MIRTALAYVLLAVFGCGLCGCSGVRNFWSADTSGKPSSAEIASSAASGQEKPSFFENIRNEAAERSVEGPLALARLAEQRGNTVDAERLYKSILEKDPDNEIVPHRLAIICARAGRFEEADAYFEQAIDLNGKDATLLCDAGYCQYLQNRPDQAEQLYRQALDMEPNHESSKNNLALVLGEKGEDKVAFALFRQTGTEAEAHANMGFVYCRRGDIKKAMAAYSHTLTLDHDSKTAAEALVQLATFEKQADALAIHSAPTQPRPELARSVAGRHVPRARPLAEPMPRSTRSETTQQPPTMNYPDASKFARPSICQVTALQPTPTVPATRAEFLSSEPTQPMATKIMHPEPAPTQPQHPAGIPVPTYADKTSAAATSSASQTTTPDSETSISAIADAFSTAVR